MRILWLFILALLLPAMAWGQSLRLAYEHYPPFEYSEKGRIAGVNAELVAEACRRLGIEARFVEIPFARALYDLECGVLDGVFSLFRTSEREALLYYADEPLGETVTAVVTRSDRCVPWKGLESLRGHAVGRVRGYAHGPKVDAMKQLAFTEVKDSVCLFRMLDSGHIDVALCNLDVFGHIHAASGCGWDITVLQVLVRKPLYIGFSRALGERGRKLAEDFASELRAVKSER